MTNSHEQAAAEMDPIAQLNYEATVNLGRQDLITRDYSFYSDYEFIPIQEDRKTLIQAALDNWHAIIRPTLSQLNKESNYHEIQDRIFRKAQTWEGELNTCAFNAKNVRDSNTCADKFLSQLNNEGVAFIKSVLREY